MTMQVEIKKVKNIQAKTEGLNESLKIIADVTIDEEKKVVTASGELRALNDDYIGSFNKMTPQMCTINLEMDVNFDVFAEIKSFILGIELKLQSSQNLIEL